MNLLILFFVLSSLSCHYVPKDGPCDRFSVSPDGSHIVFSYYTDHHASIYMANIDGTAPRRLTPADSMSHLNPVFSPDGSKVLFLMTREDSKENGSYLGEVASDGSSIKQVTSTAQHITEAIFSKDPKSIYYLRASFYGHYSPIVGSRPHEFDIWSVQEDGTKELRLTNRNEYEMAGLSLAPDGEQLLFTTEDQGHELHIMSTSHPDEISSFLPIGDFHINGFYYPSFSPDGTLVAFSAVASKPMANGVSGFQYEVYTMRCQDHTTRQVTHLGQYALCPRIMPGNKMVLFICLSDLTKRPQKVSFMTVNIDGSGQRVIPISLNNL